MAKLTVSVTLADNATAQQAMQQVDKTCMALNTAENSVEKLRVLLGKLLVVVQDRELFKPEFTSFESWSTSVATKHRMSRATLRESLMIARRMPNLTPDQAEAIPLTNLGLCARAIRPGETTPEQVKGILKDAAVFPIAEFRKKLVEQGHLTPKTSVPEGATKITLIVADSMAKKWAAIAGDDPSKMFGKLVNEYIKSLKADKAVGQSAAA